MKRWLLVLAACSPDDHPHWERAGRDVHVGGTLHVATAQPIFTIDPTKANDDVSIYVVHALYDTLVDYAPGSTTIVPRLATWDVAEATYTFHIDGTFCDGTPVTAADVATRLSRARDDELHRQYVANITSVETRGRDLVVTLAKPDPAFLTVMAMPFTAPQRDGDGAGPFRLDGWVRGDVLRLARCHRSRARVDAIEIRENVPPDLAFLMFDRGELDIIDHLAIHDAQWFEAQPEWKFYVVSRPQLGTFGWRMDTQVYDVDVRRAFNYADNKRHVVKLLGGTAEIAHGMLPPGVDGYDNTPPYPYDPEEARRLLAGRELDVTLVTYASDETERLALSFQADLEAVGVHAKLDVRSFDDYASAMTDPHPPPLSLATWQGDSPDGSAFLDAQFRTGVAGNNTHYANPTLDKLLDRRDFRRADSVLHDDAPWVWEYHRITREVVQPYVQGYDIHPVWLRDFSTVWLDLDADGERVAR